MTSRLPRYEAKCVQCSRCFQCGSVPLRSDIKGTISRYQGSYPQPIYWYHSKGNWLRYNSAADSFYIMKLFSRLFVLYCRNCPKDNKFRYFIPILRKLGAVWWLMALESPCRVLVKHNWTSFSVSCGWGATRQNVSKLAAFRRGYVTWSQDFRREVVAPCQYIETTRKAIDCATTLLLTVFI